MHARTFHGRNGYKKDTWKSLGDQRTQGVFVQHALQPTRMLIDVLLVQRTELCEINIGDEVDVISCNLVRESENVDKTCEEPCKISFQPATQCKLS